MLKVNLAAIIAFLGAAQGIFLLWIINAKHARSTANKTLSLLIILTTISLTARVSFTVEPAIVWQSLNHLFVDAIIFIFGPLYYLYMRQFISADSRRSRYLFLPIGIYFLSIAFLIIDKETLYYLSSRGILPAYHLVIQIIGCLLNFYFIYSVQHIIRSYKLFTDNHLSSFVLPSFIQKLNVFAGIINVLWLSVLIINLISKELINLSIFHDLIWVVLSIVPYGLGYFALTKPSIFNLSKKKIVDDSFPHNDQKFVSKEMLIIKSNLEQLMIDSKPYLHPDLTLSELASMLNTNRTILSRVINNSFNKNFFDFVNSYRVNDFIEKVTGGNYKHLTYSAIAYDVGFNTRTTFYKAFKKVTSSSPNQYFKSL